MQNEQNRQHRSPWTESQDEALIYLKETLGLQKWTDIAQKLAETYHIENRNHQHCRDRYVNFLQHRNDPQKWPYENYDKLIQLYMQFGNKWSEIANHFSNIQGVMIKNKFYSRLRKGIRNLNYLIQEDLHENWQKLDFSIIYKLVNCAANKYDFPSLNILSKRVQQKISFIEENIRIIYLLSWMNKLSLRKTLNNQKDNLFNKQNLIKLIEQINLIDQNFDKRHTNRKLKVSQHSSLLKSEQRKESGSGDEVKSGRKQYFDHYNTVKQQPLQWQDNQQQKLKKSNYIQIISYNSLEKLLSQPHLPHDILLYPNNLFPLGIDPRSDKNSKLRQASYRLIGQPCSNGVKGKPIPQLSSNQ